MVELEVVAEEAVVAAAVSGEALDEAVTVNVAAASAVAMAAKMKALEAAIATATVLVVATEVGNVEEAAVVTAMEAAEAADFPDLEAEVSVEIVSMGVDTVATDSVADLQDQGSKLLGFRVYLQSV